MSDNTNSYEYLAYEEFSNQIIKQRVLLPLVNYLNSKNVSVTVEELSNALKLPNQSQNSFQGQIFNNSLIPNLVSSDMTNLVPPSKPKTSRKKQQLSEEERCIYTTSTGKRCSKKREEGTLTCALCKKRKNIKEHETRYLQEHGMKSSDLPSTVKQTVLQTTQLPGNPGLTKEEGSNLVFRSGPDVNKPICVGSLNEKTNNVEPLTQEQTQQCKDKNVSYVDVKQKPILNKNNLPQLTKMPATINIAQFKQIPLPVSKPSDDLKQELKVAVSQETEDKTPDDPEDFYEETDE
ncbi:MAG: hypothetical protein QW478_01375 [Candidatus Micrarchaeaceae archaeon]